MSDEEKGTKPRSNRGLLIIGAVVLLGGGIAAGVGAMMTMGGGSEHGAAEGEEAHAEAAADAGEHGGGGGHGAAPEKKDGPSLTTKLPSDRAVVNLGTFTVNLRGSGGGRVLRTEVQLEVASRDSAAVEGYQPVLRDAVITLASDFTYADVEGVDGKSHLRDELLGRLNSVLDGKPSIDRVYFTEFVVQ